MAFDDKAYAAADATALASAVAQGQVSAGQLLELAEQRARRLQPGLGAISQFLPALARAATTGDGPFRGVPTLIKDLGAPWAGAPTLAGSRALARLKAPAPADGALVQQLKAGGFVPFAKTSVPEFGLNLTTEPLCGPACRNPWAPAYSAGGSSGGAAAAVAAGIVPVAHATDAGGSIRIPAAACGVLGLKPGRGVVPRGPDYGNVFGTMAAEFVLTRTVRDSVGVWQLLTGSGQAPCPGPRRIGLLLEAPQGVRVDDIWVQAASSAAALLRAAGHEVIQVTGAQRELLRIACADATQAFETYACRSAAAAVQALAPEADGLEPMTWAAARRGAALSALAHQQAEVAVARATDLVAALFQGMDMLLTPALACTLPRLGVLRTDGDDLDQHFAQFTRYAPFAAIANAAGCPAIAVPHERQADGRPLGVQLIGPQGSEACLLEMAAQLEARRPWPWTAA